MLPANMEQRKIAFRAWDKIKNQMTYKVLVGNTDINDKDYTCNLLLSSETENWVHADGYCIDLMQFTGVKDKHGNDIYEGDIVSFEDDPAGIVKWNSNFCCFTYFESDDINDKDEVFDWAQLLLEHQDHYIIHGNIYEHAKTVF